MTDRHLDADQLARYARHVTVDGVGPGGQARLLDGSVLVVGAGGLGSPVLQYLAAAGVGELAVVDDDEVARSNLQRQTVHRDRDVGAPKVASAARFVRDLNPDVTVETHHGRFDLDSAPDLLAGRDVVVDCSDNFATRFLANDAAVLAGVPLVNGAVYRFEGQALTALPGGPCYRCLFPEQPPEDAVPDCAEAGVLGVLPGLVGCVQAAETLKILLAGGGPGTGSGAGDGDLLPDAEFLAGRLLVVDALRLAFEEVPVAPDPDCPVCGDDPVDGPRELR